MSDVLFFTCFVFISGWIAGWILANDIKKKQKLTPTGILASFSAVALPALFSIFIASPIEKAEIFAQMQTIPIDYLGIGIVIPFIIATVGHLAGKWCNPSVPIFPKFNSWKNGFASLPLLLIWSLLEELSWRGYLLPKLMNFVSLPTALLISGTIWGLWHAPQMFLNPQLRKSVHGRVVLGALLWSIQCILLGSLLGMMEVKSGTFLVPTISHALINLFGSVSDQELGDSKNAIFTGTSGLSAVSTSALLLIIWAVS